MWLGDALPEFLAWWYQQLRDVVPPRWRNLTPARLDGLRVNVDSLVSGKPPEVSLILHRNNRASDLGRFVLDDSGTQAARGILSRRGRLEPVTVQSPPALLLQRDAVLPLAAEHDPARVLQYEMDRLTPFTAGELFWNWTVERRDRARGRLQLAIWMVPKAPLQPLFDALGRIGAAPTAIEGRSADGAIRTIDLGRPRSRNERWRRRGLAAGWAVCSCLAALAVVLPFVQQSLARNDVQAQIAALRPKVAEVEALRRRLADTQAAGDVLAAERARVGNALHAIAAVTDLLPDDTYLTEFVLRERKLTLNGQSLAAPKLIAALSGDPAIRDPSFIAPVTRSENGHADVFSIRAELAP